MDPADQVILVLEVALTIGPIAAYFLGLGLLSSQARPRLVSERADFILLTLAFVPVILWPLISLVTSGSYTLACVLVVFIIALFLMLLPRRGGGWVIYNISAQECRRTLLRACRRQGWRMEYTAAVREDSEATIEPAGLKLEFSAMPWLRNMTIRFRPTREPGQDEIQRLLVASLAGELERESMLPSVTGAGLVVIGATLLGLPLWYLFSNMNAIVDVVRRILLA